jgi:hypothetical protein
MLGEGSSEHREIIPDPHIQNVASPPGNSFWKCIFDNQSAYCSRFWTLQSKGNAFSPRLVANSGANSAAAYSKQKYHEENHVAPPSWVGSA